MIRAEGDASELDPDGAYVGFELPIGVSTAMAEVCKARKSFRLGAGLATDPATHADSRIIREWTKDPREFDVLIWLVASVLGEWEMLPHRTRAQNTELYRRIVRLCGELNAAINETGDTYIRGGGHGLGGVSVRNLMTDSETAAFEDVCRRANEVQYPEGIEDGISVEESCLPRIDELLDRVGSAARRLEKVGPIHSQPTKRGARRGYFVRRMGELFKGSS